MCLAFFGFPSAHIHIFDGAAQMDYPRLMQGWAQPVRVEVFGGVEEILTVDAGYNTLVSVANVEYYLISCGPSVWQLKLDFRHALRVALRHAEGPGALLPQ